MEPVAGVFRSSQDAWDAARELHHVRFDGDRVNVLVPGDEKTHTIRTVDTEQPGVGGAFGGVIGGAVGLASGFELGVAASALIPGVGPVILIGAAAAALIGGAWGGAAIGTALDDRATEGLPADEIFFYEDALRQGRSIVIAMAKDNTDAEWARHFLVRAGAETVDAARRAWWIGLRDAEKEHYSATGENFELAESEYRTGFEAALLRQLRGKSFVAGMDDLAARYPDIWESHAFRKGFDRGQVYLHDRQGGPEPR